MRHFPVNDKVEMEPKRLSQALSHQYTIIDSAWQEQFLITLPLYNPVFTIVIY